MESYYIDVHPIGTPDTGPAFPPHMWRRLLSLAECYGWLAPQKCYLHYPSFPDQDIHGCLSPVEADHLADCLEHALSDISNGGARTPLHEFFSGDNQAALTETIRICRGSGIEAYAVEY